MNRNTELPELARAILRSDRTPESVPRREMPRFLAHLKRVCQQPAALKRWAMSGNIDEMSQTATVAAKILEMLGRQTAVDV